MNLIATLVPALIFVVGAATNSDRAIPVGTFSDIEQTDQGPSGLEVTIMRGQDSYLALVRCVRLKTIGTPELVPLKVINNKRFEFAASGSLDGCASRSFQGWFSGGALKGLFDRSSYIHRLELRPGLWVPAEDDVRQ